MQHSGGSMVRGRGDTGGVVERLRGGATGWGGCNTVGAAWLRAGGIQGGVWRGCGGVQHGGEDATQWGRHGWGQWGYRRAVGGCNRGGRQRQQGEGCGGGGGRGSSCDAAGAEGQRGGGSTAGAAGDATGHYAYPPHCTIDPDHAVLVTHTCMVTLIPGTIMMTLRPSLWRPCMMSGYTTRSFRRGWWRVGRGPTS